MSSERNGVRIFSTPTLSFAHNSPDVHILIEDERNIVIPTYSGYNTGTDGQTSTGQQSKITAKTSLEIKKPKIGLPQIDENGTIVSAGSIFMEVEVKAEKFDETQSNTYQGQSLPAKKIREAKSVVTVRDGEIIVLGGLQEVQVDSTESKYNLLSDIPYLGKKFFRPKTVKYTPTELLIFLKPTIMRPGFNDTEDNINSIDERIKGDYKPKFTSPSGQILGMPDIDGKNKGQASDQGQAFLPTQFVMNSLFAKTIRGAWVACFLTSVGSFSLAQKPSPFAIPGRPPPPPKNPAKSASTAQENHSTGKKASLSLRIAWLLQFRWEMVFCSLS